MSDARVRHAWLVSRYPSLSHSFVRREVRELRRRGFAIDTFSLRRPTESQLVEPADREEFARTTFLLPASPLALLAAHASALLRRPRRWFAALVDALRGGLAAPAGPRSLLWSLFHHGESVLLARELERRAIGHLHVHFADAGAEVGRLAAAQLRIPFTLTLHGHADLVATARSRLARRVASAAFVACVSEFTRAAAASALPPPLHARLHVVRCGLDVAAVDSDDPTRDDRESRRVRFLHVGRLAPEKAQLGLVEAFAHAVGDGLDGELVVVGDGPERARLEAAVDTSGVRERVRFAGPLGEQALDGEYRRCDVFVLASRMEGLPVVLMEAMARERPVVAPRVGGIPELVEHERSGLLFEVGRFDELARALRRLAGDAALRRRLAQEGRRRVAALHAVERSVEPLVALLRSLESPASAPIAST